MVPKGWDVGHELQALRERMSRLFEEELPPRQAGGAFAPATDVYLTEDRVVVTVELPGVPQESVAVRCEGRVLTVSGERPALSLLPGEGHCHQTERSYGAFLRTLALPPGVESDGPNRTVKFEDGLLTVELPRRPLP